MFEFKVVWVGFKLCSKVVLGVGEDFEQVDVEQVLDNECVDVVGFCYDSDLRCMNVFGVWQDDKFGVFGVNNDEGNDDDE